MEDVEEEEEEEQQIETLSVGLAAESTDEKPKDEQVEEVSLVQSLLVKETEELDEKNKKKKKKKKVKTIRENELDRLTKATKTIFASPVQLNIVCERINSLLSGRKTIVLAACHSLDKLNSGRLSYEQFRLVIRDRIPKMSAEDIFVLTKLFEVEGLVDYLTILDEKLGNGILRHVTSVPVPLSNEIILEKKPPKKVRPSLSETVHFDRTKYVTVHLRLIALDCYNAYPGHINLTVPDHISIYTLSKMIIDERDFATRSIEIFRDKVPSRTTFLDPMRTLEDYHYTGAYIDGTHNQLFPTYTLYYDYSSMGVSSNCPILKCDYYMK